MTIKFTCAEHGGYVHNNGDIQIIAYDGDVKHGEQAKCPTVHTHTKQCAIDQLDTKPILVPAIPEHVEDGETIPEVPAVLGKTPRERALEWFAARAALPPAPTKVALPQKTVTVKNDAGKNVQKQVDDGDLT